MERKVAIKDGHRRVYFAVIIKEPPTTREGFVEDSGRKYQDDRSSVKTELVSYKLTRDLQKLVDDEWDRTDAVNDQELHWRILMLGVKVAKKFPSLGRDLFVDRAEIGSIVDTFTLRLTKADWEKFDAVRIREFEEVDGKILPEPDQPLVRRLFALALEESFKNQRAKVKKK
jgi:hypothetical protein